MNSVLREKRQIFSDLCIPWDYGIQREFDLEMSKRNRLWLVQQVQLQR